MKVAYQCDGIMLRQSNEPAGDQKIWHYHLHIIPRYVGDEFTLSCREPFPIGQRANLANKLRISLEK